MAVPFTKFTTKKLTVLTSKIDKLFIVIGINKALEMDSYKLLIKPYRKATLEIG